MYICSIHRFPDICNCKFSCHVWKGRMMKEDTGIWCFTKNTLCKLHWLLPSSFTQCEKCFLHDIHHRSSWSCCCCSLTQQICNRQVSVLFSASILLLYLNHKVFGKIDQDHYKLYGALNRDKWLNSYYSSRKCTLWPTLHEKINVPHVVALFTYSTTMKFAVHLFLCSCWARDAYGWSLKLINISQAKS